MKIPGFILTAQSSKHNDTSSSLKSMIGKYEAESSRMKNKNSINDHIFSSFITCKAVKTKTIFLINKVERDCLPKSYFTSACIYIAFHFVLN